MPPDQPRHSFRHPHRDLDTVDQMLTITIAMVSKRPSDTDLIAPSGIALQSEANTSSQGQPSGDR